MQKGRPRRSECFAEHIPGAPCARCRRVRHRRFRAAHPQVEQARVRVRGDAEKLADRARAYVYTYVRRGKLALPDHCEHCGIAATLVPWHPRPEFPREILWLCHSDRKRLAATLEPVVLRWRWPGEAGIVTAEEDVVIPTRPPLGSLRRPPSREVHPPAPSAETAPTGRYDGIPFDEIDVMQRLDDADRQYDALVDAVEARLAAYMKRP